MAEMDSETTIAGWSKAPGRRILVNAINYAPELIGCAKYTTDLCEFLSSRGHQVSVITAPPHYPGWSVRDTHKSWGYRSELINNVQVTRCPLIARHGGKGIWRLIGPLSFAISAAPALIRHILRNRPDIVLCVEPTLFSAPIALMFARIRGARAILHVQDLELDAAFGVGYLRNEFIRKVGLRLESFFLRRFHRIVTISEKMRAALIEKGVSPSAIEIIRNWVDLEAIWPQPKTSPNSFRARLGIPHATCVALYAGHVGAKQALPVVLAAAAGLRHRPDVLFIIAGDGPHKQTLQEQFAHLSNVIFIPLQPIELLNDLLNCADLHVLPQSGQAADLVLPSKLGGMLASCRPIVVTANPGTELFEMLQGVATIVPAGDDRALADAIEDVTRRDTRAEVQRGAELATTMSANKALRQFERCLIGSRTRVRPQAKIYAPLAPDAEEILN